MSLEPLPAPGAPWDEDVFEGIFRRCFAEIYRYVYRVVGSGPAAEDLAQETFLRLYQQRFPPGREHNVRAWLYRVATHLAFNWVREANRRKRRDQRFVAEQAGTRSEMDPQEYVERRAEQELVRKALVCLKPAHAQALLLRHAGLSYREIADVLGLAPGSVGTTLARAAEAFEKAYARLRMQEERREEHEGTREA
ncbi:MAG: sigma-70 family RNA polymerase sigma factor [Anaerolineae bacterium]|nr:sigma-70 family RNA polymerase sigma factor [Anaerolineae bacterium]